MADAVRKRAKLCPWDSEAVRNALAIRLRGSLHGGSQDEQLMHDANYAIGTLQSALARIAHTEGLSSADAVKIAREALDPPDAPGRGR